MSRTGSTAFLEQLVAAGVEWIFGNPGTTEQRLLDDLQAFPQIRFLLALHESVAVSAAAGYARASGKVGVVELHAAPGLGNGMGMLYNARAGQTPLVVYVGHNEQQALYQEPILSSDLVAMAQPIAKWAHEIRTADEIPQIIRRAFKVAMSVPRGPVVISLPMDLLREACHSEVLEPAYLNQEVLPAQVSIDAAVQCLMAAEAPAIVVGDGVVMSGGIDELGELARLIGAPIYGGSMHEVCVRSDEPMYGGRLGNDGAATRTALQGFDVIVAVGTKVMAHIFPVHGLPLAGQRIVHLGLDGWELGKNQPGTMVFGDERLATKAMTLQLRSLLGAEQRAAFEARRDRVRSLLADKHTQGLERDRRRWNEVPMSPQRAVAELASAMPRGTRIVDESLTAFDFVSRYCRMEPGHWFRTRGGAIGEGMPMALGVQIAYPEDHVVSLVGDGSAMYTPTALWAAAHAQLPVLWAILNNRSYRILKQNTKQERGAGGEDRAFLGTDLIDPDLDFVALARGMGVSAQRVEDPDALGRAVTSALATGRPALIDIAIAGS
jgi:benzoylformate decarboxylase